MAPPAPPAESGTPARGRAGDRAREHEAVLRRGFDEGRAAYPSVALAYEAYAAHVFERTIRRLSEGGAAPPGEEVGEALSKAALGDLYLAAACEAGAPGAWEAFAARTGDALVGLALKAGASRAEAEELSQSMPGTLFAVPPGSGARTRIGSYDGSGSLVGWLAVIVRRRLADRRRGPAAARRAEGAGGEGGDAGGGGERAAGPESDPAALASDGEAARRFGEALRAAWTTLTERERFVVALRYRDGAAQKEIALLLGVGEPRVSRSLQGAVEKLRAAALRVLGRMPAEGARDPGPAWAALERALAEFMGTLPGASDPPADG